MNRLEPEIIALKDSIEEIQACLIVCDERGKEGEKHQEQLEDRVSVLEDSSVLQNEGLEHRIKLIEHDVGALHKALNTVITRINDLHQWLNRFTDNDLRCDEKLDVSDEEFDLTDYTDKVNEEIKRVQQMGANPE